MPDLVLTVGRNPELEFREVTLNKGLLEELGQQCRGNYFSEDRVLEVLDHLPPGELRESTRRTSQPLWDNFYYLLLLAGLLGSEWVLRKRHGLL